MRRPPHEDGTPASLRETVLGATEARAAFADLIGRAAYGGECIVITRNRNRMAVLVPVAEYEHFRAWQQRSASGAAPSSTPSIGGAAAE